MNWRETAAKCCEAVAQQKAVDRDYALLTQDHRRLYHEAKETAEYLAAALRSLPESPIERAERAVIDAAKAWRNAAENMGITELVVAVDQLLAAESARGAQ